MTKWVVSVITGIIVTVVGGILLQSLLQDNSNSNDRGSNPPPQAKPEIHYQEIQNIEFQTEISLTDDGGKRPTTVWGYLDLDEGKHSKNSADLVLRFPFFDQDSGYFMRSPNSDIERTQSGNCRNIPQDPDGSKEMTLSLNTEYCVKTNQGRTASIVVHQILTSWGKYATINVRMTIRSYN